jgi:hypothetical protein
MFLINWYNVFYWLSLGDGIKKFFDSASNFFTFFAFVFAIIYIIFIICKALTEKEETDFKGLEIAKKYSGKLFFVMLGLSLFTWVAYVATPSKKDCLLIIAGGATANFITSDSSIKSLPSDLTKYLHLSLKNQINELNDDARKEIGLQTHEDSIKNYLVTKVKDLTKDEIIEQIQKGTLFGKNNQ